MKCTIVNARLSFPRLYKAEGFDENAAPQYQATFMLDLSDEDQAAQAQTVKAVAKKVAEERWGAKLPKNLRVFFGENGLPGANEREEYEGQFIIRAKRRGDDGRPTLLDHNDNPVTEADGLFYGGCRVAATFSIFSWDSKFGQGLSAQLRAIKFLAHDEAFGGSERQVNPETEFADVDTSKYVDTNVPSQKGQDEDTPF